MTNVIARALYMVRNGRTGIYIIKDDMSVQCLSVCLLPMAGRTAGPIKTKLGIGIHVEPRSVLVKVKVKVINRVPQGRDNRSSAKRDKYGGQRPARAKRIEARRAETTPFGGRVLTASRKYKS